MARIERKDVDYFPHSTKHGKKMFFIENKYGNDGYATWFKLLEELGNSDDHFLNLNDEALLMYLSARCLVPEEKLIDIINDLVRLGAFINEFWDQKYIVDFKFLESIKEAYRKRKNTIITPEELRQMLLNTEDDSHTSALTPENSAGNTQRKEEKSKEEKRRENEIHAHEEENNFSILQNDQADVKQRMNAIMEYFALNELNHYPKMQTAYYFACKLKTLGKLEYFDEQFKFYKLYKEKAGEIKHSFQKFIGDIHSPMEGGWNSQNWKEKFKESHKAKVNGNIQRPDLKILKYD